MENLMDLRPFNSKYTYMIQFFLYSGKNEYSNFEKSFLIKLRDVLQYGNTVTIFLSIKDSSRFLINIVLAAIQKYQKLVVNIFLVNK